MSNYETLFGNIGSSGGGVPLGGGIFLPKGLPYIEFLNREAYLENNSFVPYETEKFSEDLPIEFKFFFSPKIIPNVTETLKFLEVSNTHAFIFDSRRSLWVSSDYGETWVKKPNIPNSNAIYSVCVTPDNQIYILSQQKVYYSNNLGDTWNEINLQTYEPNLLYGAFEYFNGSVYFFHPKLVRKLIGTTSVNINSNLPAHYDNKYLSSTVFNGKIIISLKNEETSSCAFNPQNNSWEFNLINGKNLVALGQKIFFQKYGFLNYATSLKEAGNSLGIFSFNNSSFIYTTPNKIWALGFDLGNQRAYSSSNLIYSIEIDPYSLHKTKYVTYVTNVPSHLWNSQSSITILQVKEINNRKIFLSYRCSGVLHELPKSVWTPSVNISSHHSSMYYRVK